MENVKESVFSKSAGMLNRIDDKLISRNVIGSAKVTNRIKPIVVNLATQRNSIKIIDQGLGRTRNFEMKMNSVQDIVKAIKEINPKLKDKNENLETFMRKRLEKMSLRHKTEPGVGRTGKQTFYKVI